MKVYLVAVSDAELTRIVSIHETYGGALKVWNKERKELIKEAKKMKSYEVSRGWYHEFDSWYNREINNLSCENPEEIDNYPHSTPYISKFEVLS